jgi:curved DNA-binding protein CbpA
MSDPYAVLGIAVDSDDETIRRRYLDLVKQFSPEMYPEKFAEIREAYERLRNQTIRLKHELFEPNHKDSIERIIEDLGCRTQRRRLSLKQLLSILGPS